MRSSRLGWTDHTSIQLPKLLLPLHANLFGATSSAPNARSLALFDAKHKLFAPAETFFQVSLSGFHAVCVCGSKSGGPKHWHEQLALFGGERKKNEIMRPHNFGPCFVHKTFVSIVPAA